MPPKPRVTGSELAAVPSRRLKLSSNNLDLGEGRPKEILRGELTLTNTSAATVQFTIAKHCGCTELSPQSGTLAAGGDETIRVGVELPDHANSEKKTSIDVQIDDQPVTSCVLVARCPAPFLVSPLFVSFGSLSSGELATARHELRVRALPGKPRLDADRLSLEHTNEFFGAELIRDPDADARVVVTLSANAPAGEHYDVLTLRIADGDYAMRVPLNLLVVDDLSVVPATVFVHRTSSSDGGFSPAVVLLSINDGPPIGRAELADGPAGVTVEDLDAGDRPRRRVRLLFDRAFEASPRETVLRLKAKGIDQELTVKLVNQSRGSQ